MLSVFNILKKDETWYQTDRSFTMLKIFATALQSLQNSHRHSAIAEAFA